MLQTRLTRRGRDLADVCREAVDAVHMQMLGGMGATEQATFGDLLRRSIDALEP